MEPTEALAELIDLSSQILDCVILGESGFVLASSGTPERGEALARVAGELVAAAAEVRPGAEVTRVEVRLRDAGVFVVCEAGRTIAATTESDATAGLVVYDLRTALRSLVDEPVPSPTRAKRKKKDQPDA